MYQKFYFSILLLLSCSFKIFSQDRCGQVAYETLKPRTHQQQFEKWMEQKLIERRQRLAEGRIQASTYTIPVVVHVIHNGEAVGTGLNISNAQIQSQIDVLNRDFNRQNSDAGNTPSVFQAVAGSLSIQFVLAKRDPNGLPTTGIVRTKGTQSGWTISNVDNVKALSYWPAEDYLNIWTVNFSDNYLGVAQFPSPTGTTLQGLQDPFDRLTDGVVIHYRAFGSSDGGNFNLLGNFNKGRTATHEVGHFFSLLHIWGNDSNCSTTTDYISDTPPQNAATGGCPSHPQTSCGNVKMFQNYMDYTNDVCMNLFTQGQAGRMDIAINNCVRRKSLLTSLGAVAPVGAPVIDLKVNGLRSPGPVTCAGTVVPQLIISNEGNTSVTSFTVASQTNGGTVTTQDFTGVQLLPGEEKDFLLTTITLNSGTSTLNFTVQNPNELTDSDLTDNSITIKQVVNSSADVIPLRQNFNSTFNDWIIVSQGNDLTWEAANTNYAKSLTYKSYNYSNVGKQSWLVSPVLDFSATSKASLLFDISYALRASGDERLQIFSSTDCGVTFSATQFDLNGSDFNTTSSNSTWQPSTSSDWEREFVNLDDLAGRKNVRLAFVVTNGNGNNLYIDNIEFFEDDTSNPPQVASPYYVYAKSGKWDEYAITFNLENRSDATIYVYDLLGQKAAEHHLDNVLNQTYPIQFTDYVSGVYIVRVQVGPEYSSTKIFVSR